MGNDDIYVYDVRADILEQKPFELSGIDLHEVQSIETHLHHGSYLILGELGYIDYWEAGSRYYPLFSPDELSGAVDFTPEDVHDIAAADIWVASELTHMPGLFDIAEGQIRRLHCENPEKLKELERLFSEAEETNESGCPFYTALYLTRSDGTIGVIFPATDSCNVYVSGKASYEMTDGTNERLWSLINRF